MAKITRCGLDLSIAKYELERAASSLDQVEVKEILASAEVQSRLKQCWRRLLGGVEHRKCSLIAVCGATPYSIGMSPLRARVENGHIVLNEPTTLRDGTVIELVADDGGDDLTDEERRALHEALATSWQSAEAGRLRPTSVILDELRRRR